MIFGRTHLRGFRSRAQLLYVLNARFLDGRHEGSVAVIRPHIHVINISAIVVSTERSRSTGPSKLGVLRPAVLSFAAFILVPYLCELLGLIQLVFRHDLLCHVTFDCYGTYNSTSESRTHGGGVNKHHGVRDQRYADVWLYITSFVAS